MRPPTLPMWPGVQEARGFAVDFLQDYIPGYIKAYGAPPAIVLTGYSQGSMAIDQLWTLDFTSIGGALEEWAGSVYRSYQFGHIFRSPGIAWGNALAGLPQSIKQDGVETGGIGAGLDLTAAQTNYTAPDGQPVVHSCANAGDIYTCCSVGTNPWTALAPEGDIGHLFEQVVMQPTFADVVAVVKVLGHPLAGILELFHVMKFFAEGPNSPHYEYYPQMLSCINDCYQLGLSLPYTL
jgi:hypothetical protein